MREGGQHYSAFFNVGDGPKANIWIITERLFKSFEKYPQDIMKVLSSKDMVQAGKTGRVGVIMYTEGPTEWFDGKIEILHILYRLGLRGVNITHGEGGKDPKFMQGSPSLDYGHPYTIQEREDHRKNAVGLTPFGLEVVKADNELGIVTDTAHANDKAFYDVMEHTTLPPIMSHTLAFSLNHSARGMTDDQIKALKARGGVMGIIFASMFLDPATIDRVVEHIIYVRDLVGIDTVGIGTDYDGTAKIVSGAEEVSKLVNLTQCMLAHGLTEEEIQKVWGGNFLRILEQTIDKPAKNK
jgi:membrane dipeptidase